ncbi:MAG TPA: DUF2970 domain-containing protein [Candidatus Thioglobus sp.]|jgi:hypothetical protein|nr:DUF2970 domain-containing protein [Candidatus Thioglobus sp.]HIB97033.1 DUF2970 domain-containing protein [Candidatus Thioglobus sp.]
MKDIGQVVKAVISAMIGIGKKENLSKDFDRAEKHGPLAYIIVGLIMTGIFIGAIVLAVGLVLS